MNRAIREPVVAGTFYPMDRSELSRQLDHLVAVDPERHQLLACVAPHAGYMYSGGVAGRLFGHLDLPRRVVVMGPNHTGMGADVSVAPHDQWQTPLGPQEVDRELAEALMARDPDAVGDGHAHWREHSIEVQLPFLRRRRPDIVILPIALKHISLDRCLQLAENLAVLAAGLDEPVGFVASSDMTHYRPDDVARDLDHHAISALLARNPEDLYETVHRMGISMCGVIPATVALAAANALGAGGAHLEAYSTSGETSGDYSSVVGYAGVCIHE